MDNQIVFIDEETLTPEELVEENEDNGYDSI